MSSYGPSLQGHRGARSAHRISLDDLRKSVPCESHGDEKRSPKVGPRETSYEAIVICVICTFAPTEPDNEH